MKLSYCLDLCPQRWCRRAFIQAPPSRTGIQARLVERPRQTGPAGSFAEYSPGAIWAVETKGRKGR